MIEIINDPDTAKSSCLLNEVKEIYDESFPENEREPWSELIDSLRKSGPNEWCSMVVTIDDSSSELLGFCLFNYDAHYQIAFLSYLAVNSNIRSKGLGSRLFAETCEYIENRVRQENLKVHGLCWEVERVDEAKSNSESEIRKRRISFYRKQNSVLLDFIDYTVPPLAEGLDEMSYWLMFKPFKTRSINLPDMSILIRIVKMSMIHCYELTEESKFVKKALHSLEKFTK